MALVLGATGLFLYLRLGADLDRTVNQGLRSRAEDVEALVKEADAGLREAGGSRLTERGESFAQILDRRNRVFDATPQIRRRSLLNGAELRSAQRGTILLNRDALPGLRDESRLLATPVRAQDQRLVVVVGASLEDRAGAVSSLARLLLIGGPVALLLASLVGYGAATAALRPVESMRGRATAISASRPGQRLPLPAADDEIARLGTTLNEMLDRLEEAIVRERRFVDDASHELRAPLAVLKAELDVARRRGRSVEELLAVVESASHETDRLVQLAEDLLLIARSDQRELPVRLEPTSVEAVFAGVRERFAGRCRAAERPLVSEGENDLRVVTDPLRLEQALGSLVDNALRYGQGSVGLTAIRGDGRLELHVTDEGRGFPDDFLDRAFERFTRADSARGRGGTGLGLAIVRAIATSLGGGAFAANRSEGGADVWISLPDEPGQA